MWVQILTENAAVTDVKLQRRLPLVNDNEVD